jgi:hypothetical protein
MLEAMIGLFLLVLFILMTNAYMATILRTKVSVKQISHATTIGNDIIEKLRTSNYDSIKAGVDTIENNYSCTWTLDSAGTDSTKKSINLSVQWPIATRKHSIHISTIIAK